MGARLPCLPGQKVASSVQRGCRFRRLAHRFTSNPGVWASVLVAANKTQLDLQRHSCALGGLAGHVTWVLGALPFSLVQLPLPWCTPSVAVCNLYNFLT